VHAQVLRVSMHVSMQGGRAVQQPGPLAAEAAMALTPCMLACILIHTHARTHILHAHAHGSHLHIVDLTHLHVSNQLLQLVLPNRLVTRQQMHDGRSDHQARGHSH